MNDEINTNVGKPWYREPYVWMVISFPLTAVLAGIATVILAVESNDGLVVDDYYKRGLEVNRVLERDRAASEYGLKANLKISGNDQVFDIVLNANPDFIFPDEIKVNFLHPTRKGMDQHLVLKKYMDNIYRGTTPSLVPGKWYVQIETDKWRLFMDYSSTWVPKVNNPG